MFRSWKFLFLLILSVSVLTACGQTLDERAADGIAVAKEAFLLDDKQTNDEVQGVPLYKPSGFTIAEDSDAQNIVMKKGDETFILFINTNEEKDSRLFYDLLDNNEERKRFEEVFTSDGYFGFASVVKIGEDQVELITSVGGVKMTTITKKKNIRNDLARMMEITRSINQ